MLKLTRYLKNYWVQTIIAPLFKFFEAILELFVPLIMTKLIDIGIKNNDKPYIIKWGIVLVAIASFSLCFSLIAQYFAAVAAMGFSSALRSDLLKHTQSLSFREIDHFKTSSLVTRLTNDVNQAQTGVNMILRLFLRSPFIVIGAVIMSLTISVSLTVIFLITTLLLALIIYMIMKINLPIFKKSQATLDQASLLTRESLSGVRVIRAFSKQKQTLGAFEDTTKQLMSWQTRSGRIGALLNPLTLTVVNIGIIALLWFGGIKVHAGSLTQGNIIALTNYMTQILLALIAVAFLVNNYTKAEASASRINELFSVTNSLELEHHPLFQDLAYVSFKDVSFSYQQNSEYALSSIDFQVYKGQTIGIIGGTGSGKSTLIQLLLRFYDVSKGDIILDGHHIKSLTPSDILSHVGFVSQDTTLFSGTIRDNIKWGKPSASDTEIDEALQIACAYDFVYEKPEQLDTLVSQRGKNFSGGQKQRLSIARAIVKKPDILILDDSSSALDYATDVKLRTNIRASLSNTTCFMISQRTTSIQHCDLILVLDSGHLIAKGTHESLLQECTLYKEIHATNQ